MTSTFKSLLKVQLIEFFDFRKVKQDKKAKSLLAVLIGITVFFSLLVALYSFIFTNMLVDAKEDIKYVLYIFSGFAVIMCCVLSITKINSIFQGKDFDVLQAMPIKKSTIILVKLISLYLNILMYSLVIMIPSTLVAFGYSVVKDQIDFSLLTFGLLSAFFVPALPLAVAALVATIFTLFADRFRFGNIIMMIFYFAYVGGIFSVSMIMNSGKVDENGVKDVTNMIKMAKAFKWINPTNWFITGDEFKYVFIPVYVLVNIFALVFVSWLVSFFYEKLHYLNAAKRSRNKYERKFLETQSSFKTFLKLEFKKFFNSKMYLMNGILSGLMALFLTIFLSIQLRGEESSVIPFVVFASAVFCMSIQTPAAICINLEGRNLYVLKTMPIDFRKYTCAKVLMSTIVTAVLAIIGTIVVTILLRPNPFIVLLFAVGVVLQAYLISLIDIIMALKSPKLDWQDEKEAVKQSANVLLSMILGFALVSAVLGGGAVATAFNPILGFAVADFMLLLLCLVFAKDLSNKSNIYVEKIE